MTALRPRTILIPTITLLALLTGCAGDAQSGSEPTSSETMPIDSPVESADATDIETTVPETGTSSAPSTSEATDGTSQAGGTVVRFGDTDLSEVDWEITCANGAANGRGTYEGVHVGFAIYDTGATPPEASMATIAVADGSKPYVEGDTPADGVAYMGFSDQKVTAYSFDDSGRVEIVGTGTGVGTSVGQMVPFEIRIDCR